MQEEKKYYVLRVFPGIHETLIIAPCKRWGTLGTMYCLGHMLVYLDGLHLRHLKWLYLNDAKKIKCQRRPDPYVENALKTCGAILYKKEVCML
jgi:hypothetical protein